MHKVIPMSETVRTFHIAKPHNNYPRNILRNQRYRWYTFPVIVFLAQFQHFFNIYFFLICVTQLFERYSVSPLISNVMPWVIVLTFTYVKEGVDDFKRYTRDKEANSQVYKVLRRVDSSNVATKNIGVGKAEDDVFNPILKTERNYEKNSAIESYIEGQDNKQVKQNSFDLENRSNNNLDSGLRESNQNTQGIIDKKQKIDEINAVSENEIENRNRNEIKIQMKKFETFMLPSSDLQVGDIVILEKNKRVPADCVLLKSTDTEVYIRTDQLDGETDWKLRVPAFQNLLDYEEIFDDDYVLTADKPHKDIYNFIGKISSDSYASPLSVENMLWMNTVLASSHAMCCVVYTGRETRAVMNTIQPKLKFGLIDEELNFYSKFLCAISLFFAIIFTIMRGVIQKWDSTLIRFLVILSSVIPISLKVSIDWARYVYTIYIQKDIKCVVRNSNIPEELGRLSYLLSDKTGTLTRNEMEMKKVHIGNYCFYAEGEHEVTKLLHTKLCKDGCRNDLMLENGFFDNQCILQTNANDKQSEPNQSDCKNEKTTIEKVKNKDVINDEKFDDSKQNSLTQNKEVKKYSMDENTENINDESKSHKTNKSVNNLEENKIFDGESNLHTLQSDKVNENKTLEGSVVTNKTKEQKGTYNINIHETIRDTNTNSLEPIKKNYHTKQTQEPFKNMPLMPKNSDNTNHAKDTNTNSLLISTDQLYQTTSTLGLSHESATDLQKQGFKRRKKDLPNRVYDLVIGLSVCHNVTPVIEEGITTYQASSPDEVAIVQWAQRVGVKLIYRDTNKIKLRDFADERTFEILQVFPFTSESKRMGIIVKDESGEIVFFEKGADVVMKSIVKRNDWLEEETDNMAREGLRTLVIGRKVLSKEEHEKFSLDYMKASSSMVDRNLKISEVVRNLEDNLELLGLTGVEDRLQEDVPLCLENLRTAGIKIWMLTGDKVETATCIAISSKLFGRTGGYKIIEKVTSREEAFVLLNDLKVAATKNKSSNINKDNLTVSAEDLDRSDKDLGQVKSKKIIGKKGISANQKIYRNESALNSSVNLDQYNGVFKETLSVKRIDKDGTYKKGSNYLSKGTDKDRINKEIVREDGAIEQDAIEHGTSEGKQSVKYRGDEKTVKKLFNDNAKTKNEHGKKNKKIKKNKKEFGRKRKENKTKYKDISQDLNDVEKFKVNDIKYVIIDGQSISIFMDNYKDEFILALSCLDAIVCCRCSPTQKADIANALRIITKKRVACIGDGGNDVSMITAADVGIGIVGKEGKQASLAADFSLDRFKDVVDLFLWHGRNCYKGTARLSHLIIHRGTIISVMQAIFCSLFSFSPFTLYQGTIIVGYVTLYTFLPVFASIMGRDATKEMVFRYPELYKEMNAKKALSPTSFATWNVISFYQGAIIMLLSFIFFQNELYSIISITFSSLIVNELLMVFLSFHKPTGYMILSLFLSFAFYCLSFLFLRNELVFPFPVFEFVWKICLINSIAISFSVIQKIWTRVIRPSSVMKLSED